MRAGRASSPPALQQAGPRAPDPWNVVALARGDGIPPGQHDNPSAWRARLPLVGLALVGAAVACYLLLVEVDALGHAWDPIFGTGSDRVLHSTFARSLPVPDAALGVVAYLADAVLGVVGGTDRWHRMPWVTFLFGAVVIGLAAGGLALVVVQATVVHAWCTLCLCSAAISLLILGVSRLREPRAALAVVNRRRRDGVGFVAAALGRTA